MLLLFIDVYCCSLIVVVHWCVLLFIDVIVVHPSLLLVIDVYCCSLMFIVVHGCLLLFIGIYFCAMMFIVVNWILLLPVVVIVACWSLPLCIAVRCGLWPFAGLYCCLLLPLLFIVVSSSSSDLRRGPLTGARCSGSAIKHEEVDQPRLQEYIEVTANTYSPGDLLGVGSWAAAVTEKKTKQHKCILLRKEQHSLNNNKHQ